MSNKTAQANIVVDTIFLSRQADLIYQTLNNHNVFRSYDEFSAGKIYATELKKYVLATHHAARFDYFIPGKMIVIVEMEWTVSTDGEWVALKPVISNVKLLGLNEWWLNNHHVLAREIMQELFPEETDDDHIE